jgi:hypothetical protein
VRSAKRYDALVQRVVDGEDKRLSLDDHAESAEPVPIEELQAIVFGEFFEIGV